MKVQQQMRMAVCPDCGKSHQVDADSYALFGRDAVCMKCVDWKHVDFMAKRGHKLGLSCLDDCPCQKYK